MRGRHDSFSTRPTQFAKLLMRLGWYDQVDAGVIEGHRGELWIACVTDPLPDGMGPAVLAICKGVPFMLRDPMPELFPSDGFVTKLKMMEQPA